MTRHFASLLIAGSLLLTGATTPLVAQAQNQLSTASALSALPVALLLGGASVAAGTVSTASVILAASGAAFVVKAVEVSAQGTVYVLERVSDGVRVSVEVLGKGASGVSTAVGTTVTVSVIGAGMLLSALGQTIAFIPNEIGRALLHNERVTQ